MFGFAQEPLKEWTLADGTPVLVPAGVQHPVRGERGPAAVARGRSQSSRRVAGCRPAAISSTPSSARSRSTTRASTRATTPRSSSRSATRELEHYEREAARLFAATDKALFCTFGGTDLRRHRARAGRLAAAAPRASATSRSGTSAPLPALTTCRRCSSARPSVAIENLERLHEAIGDRATVIQTNGTDFGTQNGPVLQPGDVSPAVSCLPEERSTAGSTGTRRGRRSCTAAAASSRCWTPSSRRSSTSSTRSSARRAGWTPAELKQRFGDRLVFWGGGVDTQRTLPFGTPERGARRGPRAHRDLRAGRRLRVLHDPQRPGEDADRQRACHVRRRAGVQEVAGEHRSPGKRSAGAGLDTLLLLDRGRHGRAAVRLRLGRDRRREAVLREYFGLHRRRRRRLGQLVRPGGLPGRVAGLRRA